MSIQDVKKVFSGRELNIMLSYDKGEFDKYGIRGNCRKLVEKFSGSEGAWKDLYVKLKRYGAFEKYFPERFKIRYLSFATRLTEDNIEKLKQLRKESGETTQTIINDLIEKA